MAPSSSAPAILCAGIAVQDIVFRVEQFPPPGGKCMTNEFMVVSGGCVYEAINKSSKPTTETSSGTRRFRSEIALSAPTAVMSL